MKVSLISHAAILIEAGGKTLLSDPWWRGPCFGAQWWAYPRARVDLIERAAVDYIYVSHGHHDHFHPGTLGALPKTSKVLVSGSSDLAKRL
jgi:L-ascorbate metabolism protein UlaG (beta-lactamase superfamily)